MYRVQSSRANNAQSAGFYSVAHALYLGCMTNQTSVFTSFSSSGRYAVSAAVTEYTHVWWYICYERMHQDPFQAASVTDRPSRTQIMWQSNVTCSLFTNHADKFLVMLANPSILEIWHKCTFAVNIEEDGSQKMKIKSWHKSSHYCFPLNSWDFRFPV